MRRWRLLQWLLEVRPHLALILRSQSWRLMVLLRLRLLKWVRYERLLRWHWQLKRGRDLPLRLLLSWPYCVVVCVEEQQPVLRNAGLTTAKTLAYFGLTALAKVTTLELLSKLEDTSTRPQLSAAELDSHVIGAHKLSSHNKSQRLHFASLVHRSFITSKLRALCPSSHITRLVAVPLFTSRRPYLVGYGDLWTS